MRARVLSPHLHRPIARVDDGELDQVSTSVELDAAVGDADGARRVGRELELAEGVESRRREERAVQRELEVAVHTRDRRVHREQLRAVGERALDLHLADHPGDAGEHLAQAEQLLPLVHQHGDRLAVADHLEHLRCDQRDRLGVVEAQPAREPALRELAGGGHAHMVELAWRQVHAPRRAQQRRPPLPAEGRQRAEHIVPVPGVRVQHPGEVALAESANQKVTN